uniref:KH domain-containing protein n=1 Tax=Steinernema glaseri TaxID=37863 RepID=A0A1I7Y131_9BILA
MFLYASILTSRSLAPKDRRVIMLGAFLKGSTKIKEYFDQYVDELSEAKERQERTIEELRKAEKRLTSQLASKEETIADLEEKCTNYAKMSLMELKEKISEHLDAIDVLSEANPMREVIEPHFKKIKDYFEQYVDTSEECRRLCDQLREVKDRQEKTIEKLRKGGVRSAVELASKESVIRKLRNSAHNLASELASQKEILAEHEENSAKYAKDSAQLAKKCEAYLRYCDSLERLTEQLKKNRERLTSELASKKRIGEDLASKLASKEETIADLEEKCANYSKDSAQLAKQCEEYRQRCDELSAAKEHHERTIEELKLEITCAEMENKCAKLNVNEAELCVENQNVENVMESVAVPDTFVDRVIGEDGKTIQEIVDISGVEQVKIDDMPSQAENGGEDVVNFVFMGTRETIENARLLIELHVKHLKEMDEMRDQMDDLSRQLYTTRASPGPYGESYNNNFYGVNGDRRGYAGRSDYRAQHGPSDRGRGREGRLKRRGRGGFVSNPGVDDSDSDASKEEVVNGRSEHANRGEHNRSQRARRGGRGRGNAAANSRQLFQFCSSPV